MFIIYYNCISNRMNIIKLKDIIKPNDDFFNNHLKGKYAYWIHMRYIVPLSLMGHEGYVACEEDVNKLLKKEDGTYPKPYGVPYIDVYDCDITPYVDICATEKANNIMFYYMQNNYVTDSNITLDEIKKFRTWLASQLLKFDQNNLGEQKYTIYTDQETHVIQYYANGMYDNIIKYLTFFGSTINDLNINSNPCGCMGSSNLSSLYNTELTTCDPLSIYKKNIYEKMVEMFSNINFWTQFPTEFINEFKKYIDNIIDCNLKLVKTNYESNFVDCTCSTNNDEQADNISILKRLSESLGYIIDKNVLSRKNYINSALNDWSKYLYEIMEW